MKNCNSVLPALVPGAASLALACLLAACSPDPDTGAQSAAVQPEQAVFVGSEACATCHAAEFDAWRGSHHDLAMQTASNSTVLGDFADAEFAGETFTTRFFRRGDEFRVLTDGADGDPAEFRISHTFGVDPLQQYLIELDDGRRQALSIAWDTRPADQGGQRWFHLYGNETIESDDPLHWTGVFQNWNTMCAACHSTAVEKHYDADSDTFDTQFAVEDVGCEACHGPGSLHAREPGASAMSFAAAVHSWQFSGPGPIAVRTGAPPARSEPDSCAQCHSRRAQLRDAEPLAAFLDAYRPQLLDHGLYHADGQILDEVYVYGSFLQSAMAGAGVVCSDCHEPHSLALKADGNALCSQCHLASTFDVPEHHRHPAPAPAPECIDCHMRAETYMVVDPRRDHSFRVPRPDLTVTLGSPNACNDCHSAQTAAWAAGVIESWFPDGRWTRDHYGAALDAADRWAADRGPRLRELAADEDAPGIVRASAVERLGMQLDAQAADLLVELASSDEPLVRLATIEAAAGLEPGQRIDVAQRFLGDPDLAFRVTAAATLAPVRAALGPGRQTDLDAAVGEALATYGYQSDRPEGLLSRAALLTTLRRLDAAESDLVTATQRFPWYTPAYLNLADHYRAAGRDAVAYDLLDELAGSRGEDPALMLALGLAQVRRGDYESALESLRRAADLAPDDPYYAYVYGVALNSVGEQDAALAVLEEASERFPGYRDTWFALATISRDRDDREAAVAYAQRLLGIAPGDAAALGLLREFGAR